VQMPLASNRVEMASGRRRDLRPIIPGESGRPDRAVRFQRGPRQMRVRDLSGSLTLAVEREV